MNFVPWYTLTRDKKIFFLKNTYPILIENILYPILICKNDISRVEPKYSSDYLYSKSLINLIIAEFLQLYFWTIQQQQNLLVLF